MIVYDPTTKTKTEMSILDYLKMLKGIGDSIQIHPIRRDGYTPLITVYLNRQKVSYHCIGCTEKEASEVNALLPAKRKMDNSFSLNRVKI